MSHSSSPDSPVPPRFPTVERRETIYRDVLCTRGIESYLAHLIETKEDGVRASLSMLAYALPEIESASFFALDRDRERLVGLEAVSVEAARTDGAALWSEYERWSREPVRPAPQATPIATKREGPGRSGSRRDRTGAETIRRIRFAMQDHDLAPVLALRSESTVVEGAEDPAELLRALGVGPWTYVRVRGGTELEGVLCLRSSRELSSEARHDVERFTEMLGRAAGWCADGRAARRAGRRRRIAEEATEDLAGVTHVEDLLRTCARSAVRLMERSWAVLWLWNPATDRLVLRARSGDAPEDGEALDHLAEQARRSLDSGQLQNLAGPGKATREADSSPGVLFQPLHAYDRAIGVLAVGGGSPGLDTDTVWGWEPGEPPVPESYFVAFGRQCALAIRNSQLYEDAKVDRAKVRDVRAQMQQLDRLATLGETAAKVAQDLRGPLSAIGGFARRIERGLIDGDPNAKYAALIAREAMRLESVVEEQLEFARLSEPRLRNVDLAKVVRDVVRDVREDGGARRVSIEDDYEPGLPPVLLDREKVATVLRRLLRRSVEDLGESDRLGVSCRRAGGALEVWIGRKRSGGGDGETEAKPGDALDQLFAPFGIGERAASGLSLVLAQQIIGEHGGEIVVRTGDRPSIAVRIPIRSNQDRRGSQRDRRTGRDRRRAA